MKPDRCCNPSSNDASASERNDAINAIPQTFARVTDKARAAAVVREALGP